jgi:hypothetical protein
MQVSYFTLMILFKYSLPWFASWITPKFRVLKTGSSACATGSGGTFKRRSLWRTYAWRRLRTPPPPVSFFASLPSPHCVLCHHTSKAPRPRDHGLNLWNQKPKKSFFLKSLTVSGILSQWQKSHILSFPLLLITKAQLWALPLWSLSLAMWLPLASDG